MEVFMRHIDTHIHIERGEYTLDWIDEFVAQAVNREMDEIWLLEHCYRFREFVPMYESVCAYSDYIDEWLRQKAGTLGISDYLKLIEKVRDKKYPIDIKWGLEVCYFKNFENLVHVQTKDLGLDFLLGSTHFVDDFAFDHKYEHWDGVDIDNVFKRYYEISIDLANSGLFDGIAHPDSIKLYGHRPSFSLAPYYDELAAALAKNNMYAEMNSGRYRRSGCEIGMNVDMIKAMQKYGVKIVTASDAHCPEDVGDNIITMGKILGSNF